MATRKTQEEEISSPASLYMKLWRAKREIGKVHKNAKNPHFKQNYADLNAVLDACEGILLEHGLMILQPIKEDVVITQIVDIDSGEHIESFIRLPQLQNPQQLGSAISYYRRYTLISCLALASTDDDGAEAGKAIPKQIEKPGLDAERFAGALKSIAEGKYTAEQLKKNYSLTLEQLSEL